MGSANGKRVLVTGGTGMMGANLVRRLIGDGFRVFVLSRPSSDRRRLDELEGRIAILDAEVSDAAGVRSAVERVEPEIVFHLASTPFNPPTYSAGEHLRVNGFGTLNLLEALRAFPGSRLVFTGSAAQYGGGCCLHEGLPMQPATLLGASKAAGSLLVRTYARLYGMQSVELRLFTPYGPWESPHRLIPQTILSALAGKDIPMSGGDQQRDYVYVEDVVDALVMAATTHLLPGSVFNIGSGVGLPIIRVVQLILKLVGGPARPLVGALPTREDEIMEMTADISAARDILGWQPRTSLQDGLRATTAWFTARRGISVLPGLERESVPSIAQKGVNQ